MHISIKSSTFAPLFPITSEAIQVIGFYFFVTSNTIRIVSSLTYLLCLNDAGVLLSFFSFVDINAHTSIFRFVCKGTKNFWFMQMKKQKFSKLYKIMRAELDDFAEICRKCTPSKHALSKFYRKSLFISMLCGKRKSASSFCMFLKNCNRIPHCCYKPIIIHPKLILS